MPQYKIALVDALGAIVALVIIQEFNCCLLSQMLLYYLKHAVQRKIALENALCAIVLLFAAAAEEQQCARHSIRGKCIRGEAHDGAAGQ